MNRFLIGQYGAFNEKKYRRDFREGFYGIEACLFEDERDVARLVEEARRAKFQVGIHFPLRAGISKLRDALFLAMDSDVRAEAYAIIEQELAFLTAVKPAYVLFHYPKPVILDDRVDWSLWRFADRVEYEYERAFSFEGFKERSDALFEWLSEMGRAYGFTPVLEFDALNRYVYAEDYLAKRLEQHRSIRLCLDTARLYLQERIDPYFDARSVIKQYALYAETVHLSNVRIVDNAIVQSRYPVLPSQRQEDGWAPIEEYLRIIKQANPHVKIMFEHNSSLVSDEELEACYAWVSSLLG